MIFVHFHLYFSPSFFYFLHSHSDSKAVQHKVIGMYKFMTVFCNFRLGRKEERERKKRDHLYNLLFFFLPIQLRKELRPSLITSASSHSDILSSMCGFKTGVSVGACGLVLPNPPSCQYQSLKLTSYKLTFLTLYRQEKQKTPSCSWKI